MKLIAGLGNPGPEYEGTRHNIGFDVVDLIARELGLRLTRDKFQSQFAIGQWGGEKVLLVKPQTFVNLSGVAIGRILRFWKLSSQELLVIHDDLDFPIGVLRLAFDAGAAGHRGIESIIEEVATKEFYRLRLGIGRPEQGDPVDYVLSTYQPHERREVSRLIDRAATASRVWVTEGPEEVRRQFHSQRSSEE